MITKRAKNLLLAMSIGDGHVRKNRSELQIKHSLKQKDYCEQKAKLLEKCLEQSINIHQKSYGGFNYILFRITHPYLKFVRNWLYKNNQKILTLKTLRRLTDEAIAIWYMDDGSLYAKKRNGIPHAFELVISTCCLTVEEAQIICDFFYERYEVKMTIKKMKGRFSVRCGTQNARKLIFRLNQYSMIGMEYKFKPILEK
jgi:hypothetical protein